MKSTNWKRIANTLLYPPFWILIALLIAACTGMTVVFSTGSEESPVAIIVYVVSAYTLTATIAFCCKKLPAAIHSIKNRLSENQHTAKYFNNNTAKAKITLIFSLTCNLAYIAVNILSAVLYKTYWFAIFAVYYSILAVMRFLLLHFIGKKANKSRLDELRRVRLCACILVTVNLVLSGAVLMMVFQNRGFSYNGLLIYVMAAYTFYSTGSAIAAVVRQRHFVNPIISATKTIKLAAALFSMLSLETAMFAQFGADMKAEEQQILIMVTGAMVCIVVTAMAIQMIAKTTKEIARLK